jgi:hypothetical protein
VSKITESARGEECQVRYIGICSFDPAKTIWSHCRHLAGGKGKGMKALDLCGAYACTVCDAAYDQMTGVQTPARLAIGLAPATRTELDLDWFMGMVRSLVILVKKGLA